MSGHQLILIEVFIDVHFSSVTQLCPTLCNPMDCSMPGLPVITNSQSLLKLMSIELVMPSNRLILCHPLLLLPSVFPSIRVFSDESALRIRWPMYWSFSFSISPSNEYSRLIAFMIDWFDLLAVQGTLKSLLPTPQFKCIILGVATLQLVPEEQGALPNAKTTIATPFFPLFWSFLLFLPLSFLFYPLLPSTYSSI